jgi:streptomycin 6-kinase
MNFAVNPLIRRTLAPQPSPDPHAEPRERLWRVLLQMQERAAMLANEIRRALPDLIAGPDSPRPPGQDLLAPAANLCHEVR